MDLGAIAQIFRIFTTKKVDDLSFKYLLLLSVGTILLLPRSFNSDFLIWKICNCLGAGLVVLMLVGFLKYHKK